MAIFGHAGLGHLAGLTAGIYRGEMPERTVEVCAICDRELTHDDHKVTEYGDGWAHDECIAADGGRPRSGELPLWTPPKRAL